MPGLMLQSPLRGRASGGVVQPFPSPGLQRLVEILCVFLQHGTQRLLHQPAGLAGVGIDTGVHGSIMPVLNRTGGRVLFEVGKRHPFESLRDGFKTLYETLLGSEQGPRMGSFIALYGVENSRKLIAEALA